MAAGHSDAAHYSLGRVYDESNLVVERENNRLVTQAQLAQQGTAGILSTKARKAFTESLKALNVVTKPIRSMFDQ